MPPSHIVMDAKIYLCYCNIRLVIDISKSTARLPTVLHVLYSTVD